jgi:hypothetical protein
MEIKIRQSDNQEQNRNFIRVQAKLIVDVATDEDDVAWSIRSSNPNILLKHSNDADEETYLVYPEMLNCVIEVSLPDDEPQEIIVLAKYISYSVEDVTVTKLDNDLQAWEDTEVRTVGKIQYLQSSPITIKRITSTPIGDWV